MPTAVLKHYNAAFSPQLLSKKIEELNLVLFVFAGQVTDQEQSALQGSRHSAHTGQVSIPACY